MFNFLYSPKSRLDYERELADAKRELEFCERERASDTDRIHLRENYEGLNLRLEHIEAKYKAQAEATAGKLAEQYALKTAQMAHDMSTDFGNATGKALEQVISLLKEFKPVKPEITVLSAPQSVEVKTSSCGK